MSVATTRVTTRVTTVQSNNVTKQNVQLAATTDC